jgi:hypothetical protein
MGRFRIHGGAEYCAVRFRRQTTSDEFEEWLAASGRGRGKWRPQNYEAK